MYSIDISLRDPTQLFTCIEVDPRSTDYDEYAVQPAIESIRDVLIADPPPSDGSIELRISLPRNSITPGLDAELTDAVRRWAGVELVVEARRSGATWAGARRMTAAVIALFLLVQLVTLAIQRAATALDNDIVAALAEGVSVVGWVLLWFPIDSYLMERSRRATRGRLAAAFDRLVVCTSPID